jgi:PBSX family phage terminase large subunit
MTIGSIDLERVTKILSPKQIRSVIESQTTEQIALWDGAVSAGKTIASLIAFLGAVANAPDRGLVVMLGNTLQTIERNLIEPLQSVALFGDLASQIKHTAGATTATILGRTVHLVGTHNVTAENVIRGMTVCLAYVDEATLVPRGVWMMLLSRLRVPGAKLFATTNPDGPAHWLRKDFILRPAEVGIRRWVFKLGDNPSLEQSYVERLKRQYVGLWHRRFILGEWCLAEGAVYDMWDPKRHVVDILPPITRWIALGVDYGTTNPFAALVLGMGSDRRLYLTHEWRYDSKQQHRSLTDLEYSQRLRGWLADLEHPHAPNVRGIRPEWTVIDPSAASFVQQLYRDGLTPTLADNSVLDRIRLISSLLAANLLKVHRRCDGWINEIPGYSWDPDKAERGDDAPIKADDHSLDGGGYGVYTTEALWRPQLLEAA